MNRIWTVSRFAIALVLVVGCSRNHGNDKTPASEPVQKPADADVPAPAPVAANGLALPKRPGPPPDVTEGIPHIQRSQTSSPEVAAELAKFAFQLEGVEERESRTSLPGARALTVAKGRATRARAMLVGREFAHIHAHPNGAGSLHLTLSIADANHVVETGWGEHHPFAISGQLPGLIMLYAPRDAADLEVVKRVIAASVRNALQP